MPVQCLARQMPFLKPPPAYSAWDKVFADYPSENLSEEDSRTNKLKQAKPWLTIFSIIVDFAKELDFYTPVIIANNTTFLKKIEKKLATSFKQ